jgi:hypothetical protein
MHRIDLARWILAALIILSIITFGLLYYFDQYLQVEQDVTQRNVQPLEEMAQENLQNQADRVVTVSHYCDRIVLDQAIQ